MKYKNTHKYRDHKIKPCGCQNHPNYTKGESQNTGYWYIQDYHETGLPISEDQCSHYHTLHGAKLAIDQIVQGY